MTFMEFLMSVYWYLAAGAIFFPLIAYAEWKGSR